MALDVREAWDTFRSKGLRAAIGTLALLIAVAILNEFTGFIGTTISGLFNDFMHPPVFYVAFPASVDLSNGFSIRLLGASGSQPIQFKLDPATQTYMAQSGAGSYELRLRGAQDRAGLELVDTEVIAGRDAIWKVRTEERYWANLAAITLGQDTAASAASPAQTASNKVATTLSGTRWSTVASDKESWTKIADKSQQSILRVALGEVGTFELGTPQEKAKIGDYWAAAGADWKTVGPQQHQPWGGAFLAWVVAKAGIQPPPEAVGFRNWHDWGESAPLEAIAPGMMAIFSLEHTTEIPQSISRLLVGVVLRTGAQCIEIVLGDISNRVVVTCVEKSLLINVRRPPKAGLMIAKPKVNRP